MKKSESRDLNMDTSKKSKAEESTDKKRRCAYCGEQAPLVWVHGHGQCAHCGINVQECCQGETCDFR